MTEPNEKQFEETIAGYLVNHGGYVKGDPKTFNPATALDEQTFADFIRASQPKAWEKYCKYYPDDPQKALLTRFCKVVGFNGLLHVLRHGWDDRGVNFRAVFWKPETTLNETTQVQYEANVLHCTRQLRYSSKNQNSVDIVLFLNGIPVVSMELKCQFTGQDVSNAIKQYKFDRSSSDPIFQFNNRVLVHFAVDLRNVSMTTRLAGDKTFFLPFNQGSGGAGNVGGAGNPPNPHGETSYLWREVLTKDRLLEILQKYMHLHKGETGEKDRLIFPRYHQLDVVTKLIADVKENGSGKNYLIQHSAGSGKSNSIAWLAHRLSGLHDGNNKKNFKSVIVVTDRRVLDSQLQNTVSQFDHVKGLIKRIDGTSKQLKEALDSNYGIIITTLQKFPVIYQEVESRGKRFAVIVDEAHSSQTGDAARKLKQALADTEEYLKEYAETENAEEEKHSDDYDKMLNALAAQGRQKNLSFFAFTATPKDKTLQIFGNEGTDGKFRPFHIYSMRQAIDEGFILDVLKNYMTYTMFFGIIKKIQDNPELETAAGIKALKLYESFHPHNISQKTAVMLDHFMNVTRTKIGGKAKAMVVTASRLHAVRYLLEFKRQIKVKKLPVDVLVAFSGEVNDKETGETYTEEGLNKDKEGKKIREKALPAAFHGDEFGILVVAEKYQTGFDEPLLHTMYVDKVLTGVKAVQTLSRLNRTCSGKEDTFVLDFVNSAESIKKSFEPFYELTVLDQETDPNVVYNLRDTLFDYRIFDENEIASFYKTYAAGNETGEFRKASFPEALLAGLRPALDRFDALSNKKKDLFKSTLFRFVRVYSFITQAYRLFDKKLYKFAIFAKFLLKFLPKGEAEKVDLDGKVILEYYRLEKSFEGPIELEPAKEGFRAITGAAGRREKKRDYLDELIKQINEQFNTDWNENDRVILEQVEKDCEGEDKWRGFAQNNTEEMFLQIFAKDFPQKVMERSQRNEEIFTTILETEGMIDRVMEALGKSLYKKFTTGKGKKG